MKKIILTILNFFRKFKRSNQLNKRDQIYDDVISKLSPIVDDKVTKQKAFIDRIQDDYFKITGCHYGSKFIPSLFKNKAEASRLLHEKFGDEMKELDIDLSTNLKFRCR